MNKQLNEQTNKCSRLLCARTALMYGKARITEVIHFIPYFEFNLGHLRKIEFICMIKFHYFAKINETDLTKMFIIVHTTVPATSVEELASNEIE